jgi:hypothetical protein
MTAALTLKLAPFSEKYDTEQPTWLAQEGELFDDLRRECGGVSRVATPAPGEKGVIEAVLIALASAGAFNGFFQCVQGWLTRDQTRRLEITCKIDGEEKSFVLSASRIDDAAADRFVALVMARLEAEQ